MAILGQEERPNTLFNQFRLELNNIPEEKKQKMLEIKSIRDNIGNFISKREQINKLLEIIDNSDIFSMKNIRNRKIDVKIPSFVMVWDMKKAEEKYHFKSRSNQYYNMPQDKYLKEAKKYIADENMIAQIAQEEIFKPFANWICSYLIDNEKFKKFFEEKFNIELDEEDEKLISNLSIMFCNIFHSTILLNSYTYYLLPHF